jgi:RNA polymerase sigma factor (sigma-70 family)
VNLSIQSYLDIPDATTAIAGSGSRGECGTALRACLTENYDRLLHRLARYLGCPDQASDCLHDAWLRLGDMDVPAGIRFPEAYVYRIACNLALDRIRSNRGSQSLTDFDDLEGLVDPVPGPDRIVESRSELAAVDRAIRSLPYRSQSVLFDLRINDLTRHEVATRLGLSLRCVDTILRQTLDHCAARSYQPKVPADTRPITF